MILIFSGFFAILLIFLYRNILKQGIILNIKKIASSAVMAGLLLTGLSSNASAYSDGKYYMGLNGGYSVGKIDTTSVDGGIVGLEFGRDLEKWMFGMYYDYTMNDADNGVSSSDVAMSTFGVKLGYKPMTDLTVYALGGYQAIKNYAGYEFGGGVKYNVIDHVAVFGEYRGGNMTASRSGDADFSTSRAVGGVQIYFHY